MTETKNRNRKNQNRVAIKDARFAQLKQAANTEGISMAEIVEQALSSHFETKTNEPDIQQSN